MGADLAMLKPSWLNLKNLADVETLQSSLLFLPILTRLDDGLMTLAGAGGGESGGFSYLLREKVSGGEDGCIF